MPGVRQAEGRDAGGTSVTVDERQRPLRPFVSVCMAIHNGEEDVEEQLAALAQQDYDGGWELIVADDGSTDDTISCLERWQGDLALTISTGPPHGRPNPSRNRARSLAKGEFLAFCDHDDVVRPNWISALVAAGQQFDVVAGVTDCGPLNDPVVRSWKDDRPSDQLVIAHAALPGMIGASCGVWADVFDDINGFNPTVFGHDDVDFAWRAQFAGFTIGLAPDAIVDYRYRPTLSGLARQSFHRYRSVPLLLALHADSLPERTQSSTGGGAGRAIRQLAFGAPKALVDRRARGRWVHTLARLGGYAMGAFQLRTGRASFDTDWPRLPA